MVFVYVCTFFVSLCILYSVVPSVCFFMLLSSRSSSGSPFKIVVGYPVIFAKNIVLYVVIECADGQVMPSTLKRRKISKICFGRVVELR